MHDEQFVKLCREGNMREFGEIKDHLSKIDHVLMDVKVILSEQHNSLNEHMRRTTLAEERLEMLEDRDEQIKGGIKLIKYVGAFVGFIGICVGIWATLFKK